MTFRFFIFIPLLLAGCAAPHQQGDALAADDHGALETGRNILAVDRALQYEFALPENPSPAEVARAGELTGEMVRVGQITSLYPWVSARINLEISTAESLLRDTHPDDARARQLDNRIKYLQRVKLLIDAPE
jgi:hypothetical protein